jgi:large repetitive protein
MKPVKTPALVVACLAWLWPGAAAAQNYHYGMNTRVLDDQMADKMVELGAGTVRLVFGWDIIEPNCKRCFNWSITDAWRDEARRTGRRIFATLGYSPRWANGNHSYNYPPLDYQDWYDFVYAVVSRYKGDISLWGLWNEPNLDSYLHDGDLRTYQTLVTIGRAAARAADPAAQILGPDVSHHAIASRWYAAAMKSFGDLFDIVTVHWYRDGPDLEFMMDQLVRPFALGKNVWLSEVGTTPCASMYGEAGQALFYQQVLDAFRTRRGWWTAVLFYDLYERPTPLECGSAITRIDWSNRPAFLLYQSFIKANP